HSAPTHPALDSTGIAVHERVVRHIASHQSPRADESVLADCHSAQDGAVGTKTCTSPYEGRSELLHSPDFAPWIEYIGEHHRGSTEVVILECHPLEHRNVILDLDAVTDGDVRPDHNVLADSAVPSHPRVL